MGSMKDLFGDEPHYPNYQEQPKAFARPSDLSTSHAAARRVERKLPELEAAVLKAIRARPTIGLNWNEAAKVTGIDKGSVSPRFKPLRGKGLITARYDNSGNVIKRAHQIVWFPTDQTGN